jgi:DNA-binding MarR family transcriptional regulator
LESVANPRQKAYKRQGEASSVLCKPLRWGVVKKEYLDLTRMIERLHRRFLDVLRTELNRMGVKDLNAVQALLLANIGDEEIVIRDLVERGYYQGSNVSYNVRKLVENGYLEQRRCPHDRRSIYVRATEKGLEISERLAALFQQQADLLSRDPRAVDAIEQAHEGLFRLQRFWASDGTQGVMALPKQVSTAA